MTGLYDELRIALHGVWQRRWLALAVAWGICLLGWGAIALIPNTYQSTAHVLVQMQSLLQDKVGISEAEREKNLEHVRQALASADNLAKVVRAAGLVAPGTPDIQLAGPIDALRRSITLKETQDNLFEISAQVKGGGRSDRRNAELAKAVVQKLIDLFVEGNLIGDRDEVSQSLRFFDDQLSVKQKQLAEAEAKKSAFEARYAGLLPGVGSIDQRMEAARAELSSVESQLVAAQSAAAAYGGQMAGVAPTIPGVGGASGPTSGRIAALQGQLAEAQAKGWTDQHPDVIAMKNEIGRLRPLAAGEGRGGGGTPNPAYASMRAMQAEKQATASALSARKAQLEGELAAFTAKQAQEPEVTAQAQALDRDYDVMKQAYDKLLADREDVRLRDDVSSKTQTLKFSVIDPPSDARVPVAPKRPLLLALVLVLGLAGGVASAFAIGQLRPTYATPARLAAASGLPVLGGIGEVLTAPVRAERRQKLQWLAGGAGALVGAFVLLVLVEFVRRGLA